MFEVDLQYKTLRCFLCQNLLYCWQDCQSFVLKFLGELIQKQFPSQTLALFFIRPATQSQHLYWLDALTESCLNCFWLHLVSSTVSIFECRTASWCLAPHPWPFSAPGIFAAWLSLTHPPLSFGKSFAFISSILAVHVWSPFKGFDFSCSRSCFSYFGIAPSL